jgi:hypothetical protein
MSYQVKKNEEGFIHLELLRKEFDSATGEPLFKPFNHICTERDFQIFLDSPNGLSVTKILHLPPGYELPKIKVKQDGKAVEKEYSILAGFYKTKKATASKTSK